MHCKGFSRHLLIGVFDGERSWAEMVMDRNGNGVCTQLQSSGLVLLKLAFAVSVPFLAHMGASFDFKCEYDYTLVNVCHADAEKYIFVWTFLSRTPQPTPHDAGRISV